MSAQAGGSMPRAAWIRRPTGDQQHDHHQRGPQAHGADGRARAHPAVAALSGTGWLGGGCEEQEAQFSWMVMQVLCSVGAFVIRYPLAAMFFEKPLA